MAPPFSLNSFLHHPSTARRFHFRQGTLGSLSELWGVLYGPFGILRLHTRTGYSSRLADSSVQSPLFRTVFVFNFLNVKTTLVRLITSRLAFSRIFRACNLCVPRPSIRSLRPGPRLLRFAIFAFVPCFRFRVRLTSAYVSQCLSPSPTIKHNSSSWRIICGRLSAARTPEAHCWPVGPA